MTNSYTETEIKLYVPDLEAVRRRLEAVGAVLSAARVFERNVRYDTPDEKLRANKAVLRLREDTRVRLTYKDGEKSAGTHGMTRFEAELEVSDFDTMQTILERLGYVPFMTYEKYRTTYMLEGTEVTLDEMPYGKFVEIEGQDEQIGRVLEILQLGGAKRFPASYVVLFENVRRHLGLAFTDLTFDNFNGIPVPVEAFEDTP